MGSSLIEAQNLSNNTPVDALGIEPLSDGLEAGEMLDESEKRRYATFGALTLGSKFLTDLANTSRVFLVQCGRQGNSSMSVLARLWS